MKKLFLFNLLLLWSLVDLSAQSISHSYIGSSFGGRHGAISEVGASPVVAGSQGSIAGGFISILANVPYSGCIECDSAQIGDQFVLNGDTYTVVDRPMLDSMVLGGHDVTKACVSHISDMSFVFRNQQVSTKTLVCGTSPTSPQWKGCLIPPKALIKTFPNGTYPL